MKKTFDQLVPGDEVYRVRSGDTGYIREIVDEVTKDRVSLGYYAGSLNRLNKTSQKIDHEAWFSNEIDAIRCAKAQLIKKLHSKINYAKKSIQEVKDFRKEHYDKLNLDWTDIEILKLEKELGY